MTLKYDSTRVRGLTVGRGQTFWLLCPQGLGLYASRDIEKHTMVIEYNGTVLRNEVAIRKQRTYKSQVKKKVLKLLFFTQGCTNYCVVEREG